MHVKFDDSKLAAWIFQRRTTKLNIALTKVQLKHPKLIRLEGYILVK
jgi:hypothetical protein